MNEAVSKNEMMLSALQKTAEIHKWMWRQMGIKKFPNLSCSFLEWLTADCVFPLIANSSNDVSSLNNTVVVFYLNDLLNSDVFI